MSMTFRLTLANDDTKTAVANLVAENVLAFIDHIDVMGNNGSLVLERIHFNQQFLAFAEHAPDSYARIRKRTTITQNKGCKTTYPLVYSSRHKVIPSNRCCVHWSAAFI